jgi:hypothetical protein
MSGVLRRSDEIKIAAPLVLFDLHARLCPVQHRSSSYTRIDNLSNHTCFHVHQHKSRRLNDDDDDDDRLRFCCEEERAYFDSARV